MNDNDRVLTDNVHYICFYAHTYVPMQTMLIMECVIHVNVNPGLTNP